MTDGVASPSYETHAIPLLRHEPRASLADDDSDDSLNADLEGLRETVSAQGASSASQSVTYRLYVSHFLSTWNSRVFEFGAVLYLATIFPGTLMPMSVYAVSRGLAAVVVSPLLGKYIDVGNRLQVVRVSIVLQRLVVALSCLLMWLMLKLNSLSHVVRYALLGCLAFLASVEKLCSIMNLVSVERDWVVVIADQDDAALRSMNSQMRRIDLICKLVGPFLISVFDGISTIMAIEVNLGMNVVSVLIEYFAIKGVYSKVPALHFSKQDTITSRSPGGDYSIRHNIKHLREASVHSSHELIFYLKHRACRPSFSGALLYLTVLSFAGQMVTYLLSSGYNSIQIAIARTISVLFEISATWLAPFVMARIGPVRSGIWFINWQMLCLASGVAAFWTFPSPLIAASGLVIGTICSRIGLWGFDLSAQMIVQDEVEAEHRGSFSSIEASFQNGFELLSYASTIYFSKPEQFRWPVLISVAAVYTAGGIYASFVRSRRGHLVHLSKCIKPSERRRTTLSGPSYQRLSLTRDV